jgi:hypothetical protein
MKFGNQDGTGFGFGSFGAGQTQAPPPDEVEPEETTAETTAQAKRAHRRTKECTELSQRYEYRRAFSEVKLLEAMQYVKLQDHTTYNFITAGDVDSLSYLKVVLNQHDLDYCLLSTWCMAAEDILQVRRWYEQGRIKKLDMYLGEIFPGSYKINGRWYKSSIRTTQRQDVPQYSRTTARYTQGATTMRAFISAYRQAQTLTLTQERSREV